ncbi:MAG TPA: four helix bundle protein [Pirellulaceae bacterium]|jgi:four helix bundle protein
MSISSYRELKVWQKGVELTEFVCKSTSAFPTNERFGLTSQLRRAAVSIPSNIAEGHARESTKEYLHHISFALGSIAELETQFVIAGRLGYLTDDLTNKLLEACEHIGRMLRSLQLSLRLKLGRQDHRRDDEI